MRNRDIAKILFFICLPLLVVEVVARLKGPTWYDYWFLAAAPSIRQAKQCDIFIGSSRVAAAIDEVAFEKELSKLNHCERPAFNFGMGYSTLAEDYLGLRRLAELRPNGLAGCVVFLEAPCGIPVLGSWKDNWTASSVPGPLVSYIEPTDYWQFLFGSDTLLADKLFVVSSQFSKSPGLIVQSRNKLFKSIDTVCVSSWIGDNAEAPGGNAGADLSTRAGIRTDSYGIRLARELATKAAASPETEERLTTKIWESTVFHSIVEYVRSKGGEVVLFEMPLSSVQAAPYKTPTRLSDARQFRTILGSWHVPYLRTELNFTDQDFPDLWHLAKSRSAEFSERLARAWYCQSCEKTKLSPNTVRPVPDPTNNKSQASS